MTFEATLDTSFPDGTTTLPNAVVVVATGSNCTPTANEDADCNTTTDVSEFNLTITKTNNAPIVTLELPDGSTADLPTADEGSTVTYTLAYDVGKNSVTNGILTDVLPEGLQYVDGTASSDSQFIFQGYDPDTRTLTWTAEKVSTDGSVTYDALVLAGASELSQPLTNTATILSDQTQPDSDTSDVFVPTVPAGVTSPPKVTQPPTDSLGSTADTGSTGSSMWLVLAVLAVLVLGIGFITPVPQRVRRRNGR